MEHLCDLCGTPDPHYEWLTPNTITAEEAENRLGFYFEDPCWLVCDTCHQLILDDKPDLLTQRALLNISPMAEAVFADPFLREAMEEGQRAEVVRMHRAFWHYKTEYTQLEKEQP